ncbi:MAG: DUF4974 domain-containing protein [Odoribacteraceae bacterium]|jgi:ferric-dicitrate binding protein FerR (iron transport regulator)|nr:DUF4974 domain-containing protein [Odoribacteraceae bacterium]
MDIEEIKTRVEALLNGEILPGSEEWERSWNDESRAPVRSLLLEMKGIRAGDLSPAREKMWMAIERAVRRARRRRRARVAAAVFLPLLGIAWWFSGERGAMIEERELPVVTNNLAVLVTGEGERLELAGVASDTAWHRDGVVVSLDSSRVISYAADRGPRRSPGHHLLIVPRRGEYQLVLDDRTRVFLNSESTLRFPAFFDGDERRVFLEGEAYFEVSRDEARPFIVITGEVETRVLGTRFNVNAREGEVTTTLASGRVRVSAPAGSVDLGPGTQAIASAGRLETREVDASIYLSWVHGRFCFDGIALERIAGQLARWYDVSFAFEREELKGYLFTGMIKREYSIEQVISIIARTTRVRFELENDTVTIK